MSLCLTTAYAEVTYFIWPKHIFIKTLMRSKLLLCFFAMRIEKSFDNRSYIDLKMAAYSSHIAYVIWQKLFSRSSDSSYTLASLFKVLSLHVKTTYIHCTAHYTNVLDRVQPVLLLTRQATQTWQCVCEFSLHETNVHVLVVWQINRGFFLYSQ